MSDHRSDARENLEKLQLVLAFVEILALVFWCILVAVLVMYAGALFDIFSLLSEMVRR